MQNYFRSTAKLLEVYTQEIENQLKGNQRHEQTNSINWVGTSVIHTIFSTPNMILY